MAFSPVGYMGKNGVERWLVASGFSGELRVNKPGLQK